jgi:hypothetical protein
LGPHNKKSQLVQGLHVFYDWVLSHLNVIEPCFGKGSKQGDNGNFKKLNPHVLIHEFSIFLFNA